MLLSLDKVGEIIGDRIDKAQSRFQGTFWLPVVVYLVVIALAVIAGWYLPGVFAARKE